MSSNKRIRQFHRWVAVAFTVTVIFTSVALTQENPAEWVSYVPLFPLLFLFVSGAFMYVQHYAARRRAAKGVH